MVKDNDNKVFLKNIFHVSQRLLAKIWMKMHPKLTIIGVTGSYGKTNTVKAITTVLAEKYSVLQTDINLDTVYNLPTTLLKIHPGHQKLVLEYGVDHKNEMDLHLSLVKPSIGVLTGINPTHSDPNLLGSLEGIVKEKSKLFSALPKDGFAVLNWDDEKIRKMKINTQAEIITYGINSAADYLASNIKFDLSGTTFICNFKNEKYTFKTGLIGEHFVLDCLAAIAVARVQGLDWPIIQKGIAKLEPLKGRFSVEEGPMGTILINDSLRANPASTLAGMKTFLKLPTNGKRIAILGEMGEMGSLAKSEHQRVGKEIGRLNLDYLLSVGPLQKYLTDEVVKTGMKKGRVIWVKDVQQAADQLGKIIKTGDLLYLKGSLLRHMERIIYLLNQQEVACNQILCHNYQSCQNCPNALRSK